MLRPAAAIGPAQCVRVARTGNPAGPQRRGALGGDMGGAVSKARKCEVAETTGESKDVEDDEMPTSSMSRYLFVAVREREERAQMV